MSRKIMKNADQMDAAAQRFRAMQDAILLAALDNVPFDGWSMKSLRDGAVAAGFQAVDAERAFPRGLRDWSAHAADYFDREMLARLEQMPLDEMRIRDRVAAGVRVRIEALEPHKEAVRRLMSFLALPGNNVAAGRMAWQTCSLIWYAAGDRATDFNHYSKRGLLLAVYSSTVLAWLADDSAGNSETWAFLERRIDDVMRVPKVQARVKEGIERLLRFAPRPRSART